jgi:hypothetical protein
MEEMQNDRCSRVTDSVKHLQDLDANPLTPRSKRETRNLLHLTPRVLPSMACRSGGFPVTNGAEIFEPHLPLSLDAPSPRNQIVVLLRVVAVVACQKLGYLLNA